MVRYDGAGRLGFPLTGATLQRELAQYRSETTSKPRRFGPVRDAKGNASPREISAIVRVARLLGDRSRREQLVALYNGVVTLEES